jgi:drug/metabolite transporter (DMT)-like permease
MLQSVTHYGTSCTFVACISPPPRYYYYYCSTMTAPIHRNTAAVLTLLLLCLAPRAASSFPHVTATSNARRGGPKASSSLSSTTTRRRRFRIRHPHSHLDSTQHRPHSHIVNHGVTHFLTRKFDFTALSVGISGGDGSNDNHHQEVDDDDDMEPPHSNHGDHAKGVDSTTAIMKGRTTLCIVALLYGTLNVSLRLIYQLPEPPTASALSTARGMLACLGFLPLLLVRNKPQQPDTNHDQASNPNPADTTSLSSSLLWAGCELAFYNFLAQGLLNIGLLSTSSARASFLTQTSVVFTPVLSRMFGQQVPPNVWIACGLALVGLTVLSSAGATAAAVTTTTTTAAAATGSFFSLSFATGDWLVLGGALSWSMYLFRLSKIGSKFDEINLQFVKSILLAVFYAIWLVAATIGGGSVGAAAGAGGPTESSLSMALVSQPFGWLLNGAAFLTILYSAVGPGTVADVLQQQGQKEVSASEANIILSLEPVFTALCAWALLGEFTTVREAVGGGIILAAALVATTTK